MCRPQKCLMVSSSWHEPNVNSPLWWSVSRRARRWNLLHLHADPHQGIKQQNRVEIYDVSFKLQALFCANPGLAEFTVYVCIRDLDVGLSNKNKCWGFTQSDSGLKPERASLQLLKVSRQARGEITAALSLLSGPHLPVIAQVILWKQHGDVGRLKVWLMTPLGYIFYWRFL